jgi:hypothetical protein
LVTGRGFALGWFAVRGDAFLAVAASSLVSCVVYVVGAVAVVLHVRRFATRRAAPGTSTNSATTLTTVPQLNGSGEGPSPPEG